MKQLIVFLSLSLFVACSLPAQPAKNLIQPTQQPTNFSVSLQEVQNFSTAPALQSFVYGQHDGKWLLIGGRTDGLHQRQPFAAFLAADNNTQVYVIDPVAKQVWSQPLTALATSYQEQLQSTNMNFHQLDSVLYIIGGYGYSATAGDHITYPYLTAVDVPSTIQSVISGGSGLANGFRQVQDTAFEVTGGQLGHLNGTFYLVGGQKFVGRYNPMGPTHGPGFYQRYTDAIRHFSIVDNGTTLSFNNYVETMDAANLHRRDYNMAAQIFPNGSDGFTIFSGVFQPTADLPWHNSVDLTSAGYTVRNTFDQLLSQYHSAKLPIYDSIDNAMHTLFFGGISRYYFDNNGVLMDDPNVPFVKTISKVTRFANDSMVEYELAQKMPGFLGSGAEFIPITNSPYYRTNDILDLNSLPIGPTLVGYIYGGIESTQDNIFFINTGTQSSASNTIFGVYIQKDSITAVKQAPLEGKNVLELSCYPNPATDIVNIKFKIPYYANYRLSLSDATGRMLDSIIDSAKGKGEFNHKYDVSKLAQGSYFLTMETDGFKKTVPFVVKR